MTDTILIGRDSRISRMPSGEWKEQLHLAPARIGERLEFMSEDHHRVRNFVVREMPGLGRPISIRHISESLRLTEQHTSTIVDELEKNRFFLVRGNESEVTWAFPVTVEDTGHHLFFSTGERLDAA